ncbi:NADH-quinone oxidoreductase subunit NuoN [Peribacillus kribbensis]|uniref:NADH-quinone oxidoreductase subunit NuoN n=1 Tax=Peribacillus kribbensis TaxID=356658 RepID=UPI0004195BC3|nr:NADH-quinone oxidoreductase subunit NuoN [Peribacillus kribbensis]
MDLDTLLSYKWGAMAPEFIILGASVLLSLLDLFLPKTYKRNSLAWFALAGVILALISLGTLISGGTVSILNNTFRLDSFSIAFKFILLLGSALVILIAHSYQPKEGFRAFRGEFYYLFLTGLLGAMFMASSGDLITLFVGLELLSVSSYILAGMRKTSQESNEAAMKYVINGGIATAITLFGMSYLYGLSGTTNISEMAKIMSGQAAEHQYLYLYGLAFFMVLIGLSFKIAAAPFHMWAPDVYQGSPTPVASYLSVISKTAGFILLLRLILTLFLTIPGDKADLSFLEQNSTYIGCLAGITIIAGNVAALRQRNIKRMFAYSSIAQAGYILAGITALGYFTFDAVWFYLLAYVFMNLGAFAVIQLMTDQSNSGDISEFAGLYRRSPVAALSFSIFLLSLAGIPGTAGFIGKLTIFMNTLMTEPGHFLLASLMIAGTVISYFYYFGIMVQMFFRPQAAEGRVVLPAGIGAVVMIALAGTLILGLAPNSAFTFLHHNFGSFNDFLK